MIGTEFAKKMTASEKAPKPDGSLRNTEGLYQTTDP